jgi:class 3 adenylate cyclase
MSPPSPTSAEAAGGGASSVRRPSFSILLVALVALVTGLTGAVLGGLAWREKRAGARALTDVAMVQVAHLTSEHATRFFADIEPAARLGPSFVARGLLDPADTTQLARYLVELLRAHPHLAWASYGDRDDRFVGAWRDPAGNVYLNRSFRRGARIRLEEDWLRPDGGWDRVRESDDHGYVPRERAYFRLAERARTLAWTEPYSFYQSEMGVTCAAPLLDEDGVRGVFTVDVSLARLSGVIDALRITPRSRVFITTADGEIVAGSGSDRAEAALAAAAVQAPSRPATDGRELTHATERVLARAAPFSVGARLWRVVVLVPERDLTAGIDAQARRAAGLGGIGLLLAAGGGVALSRWIARPLRSLGAQAQRVRDGDLSVAIVPDSRDEIGTLAHAMAEMVQGLRDRDFIRDVLGRYVSPDIAAQCLRDRDAVKLGGALRTVAILMSDLRGFSALSERLGPETMIDLLNRYFARMVPVILGHGGTIAEFIGDAILVLFGAPVEGPDDAERAVRCAWAMQRAMDDFNRESRAAGLPELTMGIGVHAGRVVAGNIGSPDRVKYGVVGPPVNLAARIESLTVGPQTLLSADLLARVTGIARVGPPVAASVKGIPDPVLVFELRGVAGAEDAAEAGTPEAQAAVDLPATFYPVDAKRVDDQARPARVRRLSLTRVELEAPAGLVDDVFDLKLLIDFGDDSPGGGSYARVAARRPAADAVRVEAVFTALDDRDARRISALVAAVPSSAPGWASPPPP